MDRDYATVYRLYRKYKTEYLRAKIANQYGGAEDDMDVPIKLPNILNNLTIKLFYALDGASNTISGLGILHMLSVIHIGANGQVNDELARLLNGKCDVDDIRYMNQTFNDTFITNHTELTINKAIHVNPEYYDMLGDTVDYVRDREAQININNTVECHIAWKNAFDVNDTLRMPFHRAGDVDIMYQKALHTYYENNAIQLLEMQCNHVDYVFGIMLPKNYMEEDNMPYSINDTPIVAYAQLAEMINNLEARTVDVYMPKFTQHIQIDMDNFLKKLEVHAMFDNKRNLDIIFKGANVSNMHHDCRIVVGESGAYNSSIFAEEPVLFRADHIFTYYMRHVPSNMLLLYGDYQG